MKNNSNSGSVWVWVLLGFGIILSIFAVYYLFFAGGNSLETPVVEQINLLKSNKITDAYNAASANFKSSTTLVQFNQALKQYPVIITNKSYTINEKKENTSTNKGCVKVTFVNQNNAGTVVYFGLAKENKNWVISALKINSKTATTCDVLIGITK